MNWTKDLAPYLPDWFLQAQKNGKEEALASLTEIRLRAGGKILGFSEGHLWEMHPRILGEEELSRIASSIMEYTPYVRRQERSQGYLSLAGGYRVGLCGGMRMEEGCLCVQDVTSLCIRIHRDIPNCSRELLRRIWPRGGRIASCLLASAPGMGKTTMLRDAVRLLGQGWEGRDPLKVAVVDERGEFASLAQSGTADVLSGVSKAQGITMLLRSMSPQLIVVDEVGSAQDAACIREAMHCGVAVFASAHAASLAELGARMSLQDISREFPVKVILSGSPGHIHQFEATP